MARRSSCCSAREMQWLRSLPSVSAKLRWGIQLKLSSNETGGF